MNPYVKPLMSSIMSESIPLTIYDFNVISFKILYLLENVPDEFLIDYIKCAWSYYLNRGSTCEDYRPHTAVVVDDNKFTQPYWRSLFLPSYKGTRKAKPARYFTVGDYGRRYIAKHQSIHYFTLPGYEADDFAGTFVYAKRQHQRLPGGDPVIANREIILWTVDSDWLQLVGDGVVWHNTGPWEPRIKHAPEVLEWAYRRFKWVLKHPSEIVDYKMQYGDKSDNLPPGTDRFMIDLMNQHPKYHLAKNPVIWDRIQMVSRDVECNQNMVQYKTAIKWISQNGLPLPSQ